MSFEKSLKHTKKQKKLFQKDQCPDDPSDIQVTGKAANTDRWLCPVDYPIMNGFVYFLVAL